MANLKEIRIRLNSVKSTRQITSAMKMVSASKLRKAQDTIIQMRPFSNKLQDIYKISSAALNEPDENIFCQPTSSERVLLVTISSNRGLCGAFNSNVTKRTLAYITEKYQSANRDKKYDILCIGKKGYDNFKSKRLSLIDPHHSVLEKVTFENSRIVADMLIEDFLSKKYDTIELIYNQFRNAAIQDVVLERFLPLKIEKSTDEQKEDPLNYLYEPSA